MMDLSRYFNGVIKTPTLMMSARKSGNTFFTSLNSGIKVGDPFEYGGESYIALDVVERQHATVIDAWRAW